MSASCDRCGRAVALARVVLPDPEGELGTDVQAWCAACRLEVGVLEADRAADVLVEGYGTIVLLRPRTPAARRFLEQQTRSPERLTWQGAVVCEPRYVADLVTALQGAGFTVESDGRR